MKFNLEIETKGLTKVYKKGGNQTLAVDQIDLKIEPGIHGFLGPNGAGKTSTINMLMGAISITKGEAFIRGIKAGTIHARKMIGFLPQDPIFYGNMTAPEYLTFSARLFGFKKDVIKDQVKDLIEFFELTDDVNKTIYSYSGGMKQKIGLASALIHKPKLLILDEPTTNLDPIGRKNIIDYVKKLSKDMSIFVSSHILSEIEQLCEKVTIINKGKLILTDSIKNIKNFYSQQVNHFILDTSSNSLILEKLIENNDIINVWLDDKDNKIHIIHRVKEEIQKLISEIISKHEVILKGFYQPETTLQDVFMRLMNEGGVQK